MSWKGDTPVEGTISRILTYNLQLLKNCLLHAKNAYKGEKQPLKLFRLIKEPCEVWIKRGLDSVGTIPLLVTDTQHYGLP